MGIDTIPALVRLANTDGAAESLNRKGIARAFLEGPVTGGLTPERVADNITLHWLTNTAASPMASRRTVVGLANMSEIEFRGTTMTTRTSDVV